jgi:hypothetical protein
MTDPHEMAEQLVRRHSRLRNFVRGLVEDPRMHDVLRQLYVTMRGGELVQTRWQMEDIPEKMGWKAANFCGQLNK